MYIYVHVVAYRRFVYYTWKKNESKPNKNNSRTYGIAVTVILQLSFITTIDLFID